MIKQISIKTRLGWVSAFENNGKIFKIKFGKVNKQLKSKKLLKFKRELLNYFNHKTHKINGNYEMNGNFIQRKIWNELKKIEKGKTVSYGKIAKKYKTSPRLIGKICGQNKLVLVVPCHRVIRSDGSMGGFSSVGGIKLKKKLLEFEKL